MFVLVPRLGPRYQDGHADPVPASAWDCPRLPGRAEDEPERQGENNVTEDREEEEDDARSSCFSREESCDTGEAKITSKHQKKSTMLCGQAELSTRMRPWATLRMDVE